MIIGMRQLEKPNLWLLPKPYRGNLKYMSWPRAWRGPFAVSYHLVGWYSWIGNIVFCPESGFMSRLHIRAQKSSNHKRRLVGYIWSLMEIKIEWIFWGKTASAVAKLKWADLIRATTLGHRYRPKWQPFHVRRRMNNGSERWRAQIFIGKSILHWLQPENSYPGGQFFDRFLKFAKTPRISTRIPRHASHGIRT
jgi:hypothetical protein